MFSYRKLKLKIAAEGFNANTFSKAFGISISFINRNDISSKVLMELCEHFNCAPDDLMEFYSYPEGTELKKDFSPLSDILFKTETPLLQLANKCELSYSIIHGMINQNIASEASIVKVAKALNCDPCLLYKEVPLV